MAVALLAALAVGCSTSSSTRPEIALAPVADSPENAVRLLAWQWAHRDTTGYPDLLAGDFQFASDGADSAGNPFPDPLFDRESEWTVVQNMFVRGTATRPPAIRIVFDTDATLLAIPDPRPGKIYPWHRKVSTRYALVFRTYDQEFRIHGTFDFFLVRGDSAGVGPAVGVEDRWLIERWQESVIFPTARAEPQPSQPPTLGRLKELYL